MLGSTYQGLLQDISDHPPPFPDSSAGAPAAATPLLWRISQLPSLTAFLLLPHPDSLSRMGTAHYDITWLSPSLER